MTVRLSVLTAVAIAALGLASCADPDPDADMGTAATGATPQAQVLAAEDVFEQDPEVVVDPSGTFATLTVTTSLDMACAVVYGQTEELGEGIATDDDMGGGAHTTHQAVMRDLSPDTLYHYRVQGSGSDGLLYQSGVATFRTPPAGPSAALGPNVALEGTVTDVSSEFSADFGAGNAVDGDPATEWSSDGDGDDASITLDLGAVTDIVGFGYRTRSMSDGTAVVESYEVTVDGTVHGPFPAGSGLVVSELEVQGQSLTVDAVSTTGGNTGAAEIEVYAAPDG